MNLKKILDYGLVENPFVNKSEIDILRKQLITDQFSYTGMMSELPEAHGFGRSLGQWGIYEGNFKNGQPHGYGRVVYNDTTSFEGIFNSSVPQFELKLNYLCDTLNNTRPGQPSGNQCYSIKRLEVNLKHDPVLSAKRTQSQSERTLINLFNRSLSLDEMKRFNFTGDFMVAGFDLQGMINTRAIEFNGAVPVEWFVDEETNFLYQG